MAEIATCPDCDKKLRVPEDLIGKKVKCPGCSTMFTATVEGNESIPSRNEQITPRRAPTREEERPRRRDEEEERPRRRERAEEDERPRRRDRDEDEDRPRRRDRDEEYDDHVRPRSRYEDDDRDRPRRRDREDDFDDRPRESSKGWQGVRLGISLAVWGGWAQVVTVGVGAIGIGLLMITGTLAVNEAIDARTEGQAQEAVAKAGAFVGGAMILAVAVGLLGLAETVLRLLGYGLCMQVPKGRDETTKGLVIGAFCCAAAHVAINWAISAIDGFLLFRSPYALALAPAGISYGWGGWLGFIGFAGFILWILFLRNVAHRLRNEALGGKLMTFMISYIIFGFAAVFLFIIVLCAGGMTFFSSINKNTTADQAITRARNIFILMMSTLGFIGIVWLGFYIWYILLMAQVRDQVDYHLSRR